MIFKVQATLPKSENNNSDETESDKAKKSNEKFIGRNSREELYIDVSDGAELNAVYIGMILLSTLVAWCRLYQPGSWIYYPYVYKPNLH